MLVVGYLGALLHTGTALWTSLVATGVVAVILQPRGPGCNAASTG